ncbi:S9 family peptidase [Parasegetibacter sp. NRK P23]|uniref:alpha/beta hydrolase family protein n=1 Tax=Parasegetibacter sp. NRK P23 TaxID=2942999 RepID=UPI00204430DA|nr:acetylxylan esterase [Parasegetibacter sp. NRK P23]MCM5530456.1 alpha/beta hydrolase family protein [Parasegetibacter sp. NRK P23]
MKNWLVSLMMVMAWTTGGAQHSDNQYRLPLKEVLQRVEKRFGITLRYTEDMVAGRELTYGMWRLRPDLETSLEHILAPFDLTATKAGNTTYRIKSYEYHRKTPEEGKEEVAYLASLYNNRAEWETRREELKTCMWKAIRLDKMPERPQSAPIVSNYRKMDGYTIENIAIEILPGLYVNGSVYKPVKRKGKVPVMLCPDGHWEQHRYRADCQYRCAMLAKMGCIAISYDLFAWGESLLQFKPEDHRRSLAMTIQVLGTLRILDCLLSWGEVDTSRVGISGGSGGGSHTMLITALDPRIRLSAPAVMLSSYHSGGCPCESGQPIHWCGGGTNNPEIAAMAAPRPQLIISDGKDWTEQVPRVEFPYLKRMYALYGAGELTENRHFPEEGHDYGFSKRNALYGFLERHWKLKTDHLKKADGSYDEHSIKIEQPSAMFVFGENGERLPPNAIKGFGMLEQVFESAIK